MKPESEKFTDDDLLYAADARCGCGAGLACPLDNKVAFLIGAWRCSAALKGGTEGKHDSYPFAFYKIREETSINNHGGLSTRPPGTVARTVGHARCPVCEHEWESEPYVACGAGHHWFSGPCPGCGYAVGGDGTWRTGEGESIKTRYRTVVVTEAQKEAQP